MGFELYLVYKLGINSFSQNKSKEVSLIELVHDYF
jgi:hypothetical protein